VADVTILVYINMRKFVCDVMICGTTEESFQERRSYEVYDSALMAVFFVFINSLSKKIVFKQET